MVRERILMRKGILLVRDVSDRFLAAVQGSNTPVVRAHVFKGGSLIRENNRPGGGMIDFDISRIVEGSLQGLVLVDEQGDEEPIDTYGCQVNITAGFDLEGSTELVSLGWFAVDSVDVDDAWEWPAWGDSYRTSRAYTVNGSDLMNVVSQSDFLSPQQPTAGADGWETIEDLCAGIVSTLDPGFTAATIPSTGIVFAWSRLDAIKSIAKALWNASPVMTPDGQLTLATDDGGDTAPLFGAQVNIDWWRKHSDSSGVKNGVTFIGAQDAAGNPLVGYATEDSGPVRWGGDFGFRPDRITDVLMDTQAKVDAAAQTYMRTIIDRRASVQSVSALWNPAVELRDRLPLVLPDSPSGVDAVVSRIGFPLTGGSMQVDLRLPWRY